MLSLSRSLSLALFLSIFLSLSLSPSLYLYLSLSSGREAHTNMWHFCRPRQLRLAQRRAVERERGGGGLFAIDTWWTLPTNFAHELCPWTSWESLLREIDGWRSDTPKRGIPGERMRDRERESAREREIERGREGEMVYHRILCIMRMQNLPYVSHVCRIYHMYHMYAESTICIICMQNLPYVSHVCRIYHVCLCLYGISSYHIHVHTLHATPPEPKNLPNPTGAKQR